MNTAQKFFHNIIHNNAITYQVLDSTIGDLDKNSRLAAKVYEQSSQILGNSISQNEDLLSVLISSANGYPIFYNQQFLSDNSDTLKQSLQNSYMGIGYTSVYATFDISTHISTNLFSYNASISSSFISAQIYKVTNSSITNTSRIICSQSDLYFDGYFFRSHLSDIPLDISIYGLDGFNGTNYNSSNLIKFDFAWSSINSINNLIINLNYSASSSNYYFCIYWGCYDSAFLSTTLISNNFVYSGTNNFINNIGVNTTSLVAKSLSKQFSRKNFWNNRLPYSLGFLQSSFVDSNYYLFTPDRLNQNLYDGIPSSYSAPEKYLINSSVTLQSVAANLDQYIYLFFDSTPSGTSGSQNVFSSVNGYEMFTSKYDIDLDSYYYQRINYKNAPLFYIKLQKNPAKSNLANSFNYEVIDYKQLAPSAFVKNLQDTNIWDNFAFNVRKNKNYYSDLAKIIVDYLSTLDNFIATFLFGTNSSDVSSFFQSQQLTISQRTLKNFTQPYGYNDIDPLNFSEYEEKSIYKATNIVPSKEFVTFTQGMLKTIDNYSLPENVSFEIFKPLSVVCNGIDPYSQGTGLAFDYALNLTFEYQNQNTLNKTLYLMASKYFLSQKDYENRVALNQDTTGYYYYVDPVNTQDNTQPYSVSSINEFYLYGYAGLIPDLKDGVTRPILTRQFSPQDGTKFTYDQYVAYLKSQNPNITDDQLNDKIQEYLDNGNQFYTIDTQSHNSNFTKLSGLSLSATNMINTLYSNKFWNDVYPSSQTGYNPGNEGDKFGFTNLYSQINSGIASLGTSVISNISVGNDCNVVKINVLGLGASQVPGTYKSWILPPRAYITTEQAAQIQYNISSSGYLDGGSIQILNNGSGFSFEFPYTLTDVPLNGVGAYNAQIYAVMDNCAKFTGLTSYLKTGAGYAITSFTMTSAPKYGYNAGFKFNPYALNILGITNTSVDINILLNNFSTMDSFIISNAGLSAGDLENLASYTTPSNNFSQINYTIGTSPFVLYDDSLFNSISIPSNLLGSKVNAISLNAKLIQLSGYVPSGTIQLNVYDSDQSNQINNVIGSSDLIQSSNVNSNNFSTLTIPLNFTLPRNSVNQINGQVNSSTLIWVEVKQNLNNCFLALYGTYKGISTSGISISTSYLSNSVIPVVIPGSISTIPKSDLDIGRSNINFNILNNYNYTTINSCNLYLRKNSNFNVSSSNYIYLAIQTSGGFVYSNQIPYSSITTTFTGIGFTFSSINTNTIISSNLISSIPLGKDQVYLSRDLSLYNVGAGNTSLLQIGTTVLFDYNFDIIFQGINKNLYGAFNYTDTSQFSLAPPNLLRAQSPLYIADGYWAFSNKAINQPISIYPRAYLSASTLINDSSLQYSYLGYTNSIFVNLGYNSNSVYKQELITLNAQPTWKSTWMFRNNSNFKDFSLHDVAQISYNDSINYVPGTISTLINITSPTIMNAIFEGTFTPNFTGISTPAFVPLTVNIGTSGGVQVYINNSVSPIINTFTVVSSASTSIIYNLDSTTIQNPINFSVYYFTLSTASISMYWNLGIGQTLVNKFSSVLSSNSPYVINAGYPVDNLIFMNISKSLSDAQSVNFGFPPGDSFIIRSS